MEVLLGARQLLSSGDVAAIIWEKAAFHERTVQDQRTKAIFDILDSYGFEHFFMHHEDQGLRLMPLQGKDLLDNIFSLAPNFDRKERYA